jgi:hypothetical protein
MTKMTREEAIAQGFVVDTHCYPWCAYRGPRFQPDEQVDVWTDEEARLRALLAGRDATAQSESLAGREISIGMTTMPGNEPGRRVQALDIRDFKSNERLLLVSYDEAAAILIGSRSEA